MADETFPGFDTSGIEMEEENEEDDFDLRAPAFDFNEAHVKVNAVGQVVVGGAVEAYRFWVMKCLLTERYKYPAYSSDFGVEIEDIMRSDYPRDITESEIQRTITEALGVDERTVSISNFEFEWSGDSLCVSFEVDSIYGNEFYRYEHGGDEIGHVRVQAA